MPRNGRLTHIGLDRWEGEGEEEKGEGEGQGQGKGEGNREGRGEVRYSLGRSEKSWGRGVSMIKKLL